MKMPHEDKDTLNDICITYDLVEGSRLVQNKLVIVSKIELHDVVLNVFLFSSDMSKC